MSESIHAGYLPIWNPYINYGLPQYGDMSSGFWSPITWLIASTVGYNSYSFTIEESCYIFLAGLGMYLLTSYWGLKNRIRLIAGVAYMCCGYMVGHLQHFNWISGAAFLPWCLFTYLHALKKINLSNLLKVALSFSLFFSSAHPGLIIGAIYFFALIFISHLIDKIPANGNTPKIIATLVLRQAWVLLVITIFICGPIIGYLELLPHISRADKLSVDAIAEPANLKTWLSLILPLSTTKNDSFFATDISMRNSYFGLLFLLAFITGLAAKKTKWQYLFLLTGFFFSFLSIGGIFKTISFNYLPLIGYVRLTGEFRIFTLLSFILFSAIQLNKTGMEDAWKKLRPTLYFLLVVLAALMSLSLYQITFQHQSIFFENVISSSNWRENLKWMIEHLTIFDTILLQGTLQVLFLLILVYAFKKCASQLIFFIALIELMFATLFNIPFTGVGKASLREVQQIFNNSPGGIPIPPLQATVANDTLPWQQAKMVGDWSFYNKQLGVTHQVLYPIRLKTTDSFFSNMHVDAVNRKEYVFVANDSSVRNMRVTQFTPNSITINMNADTLTSLVYKQNYYPYWISIVNNTSTSIQKAEQTFLSVNLKSGQQIVTFQFINKKIVTLIGVHLLLFVLACALLIYRVIRHRVTQQI